MFAQTVDQQVKAEFEPGAAPAGDETVSVLT